MRISLSVLTVLCVSLLSAHSAPEQPNVLFVYTDDQAAWTVGVSGNVNISTPNMDRLFQEGAYFVNHFTTTPVCSPSRAGLMVSRYSTEVGILDYINPGRDPDLGLDPGYTTWAEILSDGGYATAFFGKWHLGSQDRHLPTRQGYQEFSGFRTGAGISRNPTVEVNGQERVFEGYTPDILTGLAMDFIRAHRQQPFLVSLHYWAPHANTENRTPAGDRTWLPLSPEDWGRFRYLDPVIPNPDYPNLDIPRVKRMMREYLGSVASVDRNLGNLLDLLDELGLTERTIVIFSSDNGFNMGHNGIWHKGNGRWILNGFGPGRTDQTLQENRTNLYDNSLRVPAAVRWPGVVVPGTVIHETTANLDWFPTILEATGSSTPVGETIRGRSLLPLLRGGRPQWDNDFFAQYSQDSSGVRAALRCFRTPEWKLIRDFLNPGKDELYDLSRDPEESSNLIVSPDPLMARVREALDRKLLARMVEIGDPALPNSYNRNSNGEDR